MLTGQVLSVILAIDVVPGEDGQAISLPELIDWWRGRMTSQLAVIQSLGAVRAELGLWLQTYPAGQPNLVDLTFEELPRPTQGAPASPVPPWSYRTRAFDIASFSAAILRPPTVSLLSHFTSRHLHPPLSPSRLYPP